MEIFRPPDFHLARLDFFKLHGKNQTQAFVFDNDNDDFTFDNDDGENFIF